MARVNDEVAAALFELADLLEISGAERFRILTYRRAATEVEALSNDLSRLTKKEVMALRGVGRATAAKIAEYLDSGTMKILEEARLTVPNGVREMMRLAGLGPKKALLIYHELGIASIEELKVAVTEQRLRTLVGLGPKTEDNLLRAFKTYSQTESRVLLDAALAVAERMIDELSQCSAVANVTYAGSLRRMQETIGDIDILVASDEALIVTDAFVELADVADVAAHGLTKISVITNNGLQVDLRVIKPDEFGAALQYFTGSKDHNVKVREIAVKQGMKLSEYGLFRGIDRIASRTEDEIYGALGMQTPPPTLRSDRGEVELALKHDLPKLVQLEDIRGDLHSHTAYSDGHASVAQMVAAAADKGYEYFAITDHGRNIYVKSLSLDDLERQRDEIAKVNATVGSMTVLHGVECNIGIDGELDYPDEVLARFDVVIASLHQHREMDSDAITKRIITALQNPHVNILGHPTGRSIGKREPMAFDLEAVFETASNNKVALEINSNPRRLDLRDEHIRHATQYGCKFAINCDSHHPSRLGRMMFGVATAQRGWATKKDVINCWPLTKLKDFLAK
ncbi:MAG: DNA polymerase/3'-5' exonuclease PolX [Actinomycetota bacterium]